MVDVAQNQAMSSLENSKKIQQIIQMIPDGRMVGRLPSAQNISDTMSFPLEPSHPQSSRSNYTPRPKSGQEIAIFRDTIRHNLLGVYDTSKLQNAFDALFEIIGTQQDMLDRLDREMTFIKGHAKEQDRKTTAYDRKIAALRTSVNDIASSELWLGSKKLPKSIDLIGDDDLRLLLMKGDAAGIFQYLKGADAATMQEFFLHADQDFIDNFQKQVLAEVGDDDVSYLHFLKNLHDGNTIRAFLSGADPEVLERFFRVADSSVLQKYLDGADADTIQLFQKHANEEQMRVFLENASAGALEAFLEHADEGTMEMLDKVGQSLRESHSNLLSIKRKVNELRSGDNSVGGGFRSRTGSRVRSRMGSRAESSNTINFPINVPEMARDVLLEELKLEMQCKTDIHPHGEDGCVILETVEKQLIEIANLRATPDPPTRVFGKLLLDELRDVMINTCTNVNEDDRQKVIDFMSHRLVVSSPGFANRTRDSFGKRTPKGSRPSSGVRGEVVLTLNDITESEKNLLTESERVELMTTGLLTPHVEPREADVRSFDLTGVWDDFSQKEMTHLAEGARILNQRMDDVTTLLDALKSSLREKESKEEEWRSGVGTKLLDFEKMLSDINEAALLKSTSMEGQEYEEPMTDGNLTRASTPGGTLVAAIDPEAEIRRVTMEADINAIKNQLKKLHSTVAYRDQLNDMLRLGGNDGKTFLPWSSIESAGELESHLRTIIAESFKDLHKDPEIPLSVPVQEALRVAKVAELKAEKSIDDLLRHMEVLKERIQVVSQNEEHYRELIITDLDDLRLKLSQAEFGDDRGDSRDVTRVYRQVMGEGMEHEDLQKVTETVRRLNREQMVAMSSFVGEVRKLQNDMESRPSEERIKHMIDQMDTVFKQNMGENLVGLRLSVGQVLHMVENKASKQDVLHLLLESMKLNEDQGAGGMVAGMVKCISCGYNYAPKGPGTGKRTAAGGTRAGKAGFGGGHMYGEYYPNAPMPGSSSSSVASQDTLETLDDGQQTRRRQQQQAFIRPNTTRTANSVASPGGHSQYSIASPYSTHSAMYALSPSEPSRSMLNGITSEEYNRREAEAFLTVLRRQGGLQPVSRQSQPMSTKANPYGGTCSQGTKAGALTTPGSSEPLFRKARLAQHLKEMVKVPLTSQGLDKGGSGQGSGNYAGGRYGGGYDDATISTTKSAPSGLSSMQQTTVMEGMGGHHHHHHTPTHAPYGGGSNGTGGNNHNHMNTTPTNVIPHTTMSSANYTGPSSQNHHRMANSNSSSGKSLRMHSGNTVDTTTATQPYDNMNINNHRK